MSDSESSDPNTDETPDASADPAPADASTSTSVTAVTASSSSGAGVNAQILDAVTQTNSIMMENAPSEGAAVAYQKVAQAAAFAVQDATDYNRNMENIAMAAQGVIVTKMLEDQSNIPIYTPVLVILQDMVTAATTNMATVGTTSAATVAGFPSKAV